MYEACKEAMLKICSKKLHVLGKHGALLGPGWGLKTVSFRKSITALVWSVREAAVGSSRPGGFWLCDEA
jgi:hypothetical protein